MKKKDKISKKKKSHTTFADKRIVVDNITGTILRSFYDMFF